MGEEGRISSLVCFPESVGEIDPLSLSLYLARGRVKSLNGQDLGQQLQNVKHSLDLKEHQLVQWEGANLWKYLICCVIPGGTTERQAPPPETRLTPNHLQCRASTGPLPISQEFPGLSSAWWGIAQ